MNTNQQVVLETLLDQKKSELNSSMSDSDFFTLFVVEQVLKDYELSYEEIIDGITDGGGDGGIDAIYTFINGELVAKNSEPIEAKKNALLEIFIFQTKNEKGFKESPIEKCNSSALDLFDLNKNLRELRRVYNIGLISNVDSFRKQFLHIISKFPTIKFNYLYASKGIEVHENVRRKVNILQETIRNLFDNSEFYFEFLTSQKLLALARKVRIQSKELALNDNPISTQDGGYIALVPIKNYFDFIVDDEGKLIKHFFDANIRDYQGKVEVNKAIRETLENTEPKEDFWWLNNGVTITATKATIASKRLQVEDPQIVNGLQTSFEIYHYFKNNKIQKDARNILLRIITPNSEKSRLRIIRATNSQTRIPPSSLRATDLIHRDIEDYLISFNYYYDRRKNYYKNQGKPINKIISISYLAQIVMAIYLQEPDYARARPASLLKKDSDYKKIFNDSLPLEMYLRLIEIQKLVESELRNSSRKLSRSQIGDIKFHVSMYLTCRVANKIKLTAQDILNIDTSSIDASIINEAIENVYIIFDAMGGDDITAKGKDFVKEIKNILLEKIST